MMQKSKTTMWVLCSLFAALIGVLSQIIVPVGPVPINLATLGVLLAGGLLGCRYGAVSLGVYLLMGIVGLPVFTMMQAGIGRLAGPTGGYLIGYPAGAALLGLLADRLGRGPRVLVPAMALATAVWYTLGTAWYMVSMEVSLLPALGSCVLPFLPGDAVKIALAAVLVRRLYPVLARPVGA